MLRTPCDYDHCNFPSKAPVDDDDEDDLTPHEEGKELKGYEIAIAIIIPIAVVVGVVFLAIHLVSRWADPHFIFVSH